MGEQGREVARIEGFALGALDGSRFERADNQQEAEREAFSRSWLSPAEGIDAFERILTTSLPRVIVSTRDFGARLAQSLEGRADMPGDLHGAGYDRPIHPRPELMNPFVAPRNPLEEQLAAIWQEVIGLEQVGINDDFNDLGGDSLLITRIHERMKATFEVELSVAELMQYPNIADLAGYMTRESAAKAAPAIQGENRPAGPGQARPDLARPDSPASVKATPRSVADDDQTGRHPSKRHRRRLGKARRSNPLSRSKS